MVMHQKADDECHRLNSCVMIDDKFDFQNDYKTAKANSNFFFSIDDSRIVYPCETFSINSKGLSEHSDGSYKRYCHTMEVGIVDQMVKDCTNCTPCQQRKKEQILADTANLLRKLLNGLGKIALYEVTDGSGTYFSYEHPDIVEIKLSSSVYTLAKRVAKESQVLKRIWKERNASPSFIELEVPVMMLVGNFAVITICELCPENETEFSYKKYEPTEPC